jgi:hypothetical protein
MRRLRCPSDRRVSSSKSSQAHDTGFELRKRSSVSLSIAAAPVGRLRTLVLERIPAPLPLDVFGSIGKAEEDASSVMASAGQS